MNKKKVQNNKDEERPDFSSSYPQEYREKSDAFVDRAKLVKERFNSFIDNTRKLLNDTPFKRGDYSLDDTQKKELEECLKNWEALMKVLDYIERNVKKYTNLLLWCFQGNKETGKVIHNFYMINETGFEDVDNPFFVGTEVVPDVLPLHLFDMQALFMLLASCAVSAWKTQQDVIAIFEKDPLKIKDHLNKGLKPLFDYLFEFKEQMDNQMNEINNLKETLTEQRKFKATNQNDLADWTIAGIRKYCLSHKQVLNEMIERGVKIPRKPTVIKMFNNWNCYLKASKDKRNEMKEFEPYPKYTEILYVSQKSVEEWGENIFAPNYLKRKKELKDAKEEKRQKSGKKRPDALNRFIVGGTAGEELMDSMVSKDYTDCYFDEEME